MISFDLETYLIVPGLAAPPPVCASFAGEGGAWVCLPAEGFERLAAALGHEEIAGANIAYDFCVTGAARPDLLPAIFDQYDRGLVHDVLIAQALDQIAKGTLFLDPTTGGPLRKLPHPDGKPGKVTNRYSLEIVTAHVLGRTDAKANDEYRLRYGSLDGLPIEAWPVEARQYPVDDARNTLEVALAQRERHENLGPLRGALAPRALQGIDLDHMTLQARAAFAMALLSAWGLKTDPERVATLGDRLRAEAEENRERFLASGLTSLDGKEPTEIKRRVIRAYRDNPAPEADQPCALCGGAGTVPSPKTGKPIQCKPCGATGIQPGPMCPRTAADGIKADRDALEESGDELLEAFADASHGAKLLETYLPQLERATIHPINVPGNVLVDSGRASFEGILQTMPRKGGARECVVPRPGFVFCSVDYNALEFATLGQVCLWTVGYSSIADALNSGKDAHSMLGARMIGIDYDLFRAALAGDRAKELGEIRQGSKAGNFGFGGRMGAAKFALTQRRARIGGHGSMCRLMAREVHLCGSSKLSTWKKRPVPPVCDQCCDVSEELRLGWLDTWIELPEFFAWVDSTDGIKDGRGRMVSPGTGLVRGGLNVSAGCNHPFQHLAACGAKHALWNVTRECYVDRGTALYGSRPVIFAHDEIVAEVPEAIAHEAGHRLAEVMIASMREFVPDVQIGAEPALMRRWYKEAKTVYDAAGRLIPWEPK